MTRALATMLQGVFDYAGLFPPARLDMTTAVRNYIQYRSGSESEYLSRFVCPSSVLADLAAHLPEGLAVPVAVIGEPGNWDDCRARDVERMNDFLNLADEKAEVHAYEVLYPEEESFEQCIRDLKGFESVEVYLELPWSAALNDQIPLLVESDFIYPKMRTGGMEASAFPSSETLAAFLHNVVSLDWSFKLTAGLHHPFPSTDHSLGVRQHGLVSVIGAVALTLSEHLSQREIARVLEADPHQWRFQDGEIHCLGHQASLDDVEAARDLLLSIGTCSVEEPLQELDALGFVGGERR